MNGKWKERIIKILEFVALPIVAILFVLWILGIFSFSPYASTLFSGNGGARFSGLFGNKTATVSYQTEPTAEHGTGTISGVPVNFLGSGSLNAGSWPSGTGQGIQDCTITGDQTGATVKIKVNFAGNT